MSALQGEEDLEAILGTQTGPPIWRTGCGQSPVSLRPGAQLVSESVGWTPSSGHSLGGSPGRGGRSFFPQARQASGFGLSTVLDKDLA